MNKKMKSIYRQLFVIAFLVPTLAIGQVERTKEISKSYDVTARGSLTIDNKYGDVHVETWDRNRVEVVITVTAIKGSAQTAEEYLDKVDFVIRDSDKNDLEFKTVFNGNINNRRNERLEIEYNVKAPKTLTLGMDNSYGNLYIGESSGDANIKVGYGNLKADRLTGNVYLKVAYGNGEVDAISKGEIIASYSNLSVDNLGDVEVTNNYSNMDLGEAGTIEIANKYGNMTLQSVKNLDGYCKYGSVKVDKLYESLVFDATHGGGIKVYWISKDFLKVDIESSYASIMLVFEKGFGANMDAEMNYCDLKNNDIPFDHTFVDEGGTQKIYRGQLGSASGRSTIIIESGYGSARLSYAN